MLTKTSPFVNFGWKCQFWGENVSCGWKPVSEMTALVMGYTKVESGTMSNHPIAFWKELQCDSFCSLASDIDFINPNIS